MLSNTDVALSAQDKAGISIAATRTVKAINVRLLQLLRVQIALDHMFECILTTFLQQNPKEPNIGTDCL